MFRPLRRKKRAITDEEARELLATCKRGVFAVNGDDGYPYAIPVNYFFDAEHDKIYFHGAKAGHKVDALKRDDKVCFTVYGNDWYKNFNIDFILRAGVVYNNSKYFVGTSFLGRTYDYYRDNFSLNNGFGTLQIYAGFNFYLKKEHRKKK